MSKATKRKHVTREVLDEFVKPDPKQIIVKIIGSRGNNLHEAETADGRKFLISMPSKFRKNVWIKRGNFVIVDPIKEGQKVCGEIAHILYKEQVKYLKKEGLWPQEFLNEDNFCVKSHPNDGGKKLELNVDDSGTDSSTDDELFVNPNHAQTLIMRSDSSSDEEVSEEGNETISNNDE